ncbi:hypothetical protein Mp_2g08260 [Marchantia polymorpha subsp. ruderalis]|uniref:TF-B3 domain-containing protein n=1 Tax=Marchantia polymorpha TaxID=3197 RepID=A0A2R6VYS6_MARPO|nr:hypothetical protein MARPO_0474s0001 [Marchantia polymorpha]BBN01546.1 hypothetical protein Mp_2g08260 [Marchantia polymorpha subsp. ruderalis]|eukprot:PTQ26746.1 hypothetical protein MARPO_0474s0001 [Marchantia polymorpha]
MHSTVSWRPAPSGCMSGTLNDVLMFTSRNRPATLEMSEDKDVEDKDLNPIEWQLLRDGVNGTNSRPKPSDPDFRLPFGSSQKQHVMAPAAPQWDSARNSMDGRVVVNYLRSFGPGRSDSSTCSVEGQVRGIRRSLDGHLLSSMVNRDEVPDREEEFGTESQGLSSLILGQGVHSSAQLFGCGLVVQSAATKGQQQVHRAPHFRNLFPEQSSSFSSVLTQESLPSDVNEHIHPQKKPRRYDFVEPLSQAEIDTIRLNEESHYRNSYPPRGAPLADFIDAHHSYKIPAASFSTSLPDRPTFTSNIPLQNLSLSNYQVSSPSVPLKSSSNDTSSARTPLVDYSYSSVDTKLQNGMRSVARGGPLLSGGGGFKPLNLMDGPTQAAVSRDYLQSGSMGQVCSIRPTSMETGSRAAWPAGFINFPPPTLESSGCVIPGMSSRRSLLDLDHHHHHHHHHHHEMAAEEREVQRVHPISESQLRLVIQKQLTTTDVGSLGRIILPKKEAETHLPHLPDKEGIEMCLYDHDVDRTWIMKYRFWPNNKSRMYLLENTGEFAKYHGLQQGDLLLIYRQLPARYVLRVKKMAPPLRLVTPPQSISESGGAEDLVSGAAETVSSRALTSSASSRTLNSSSAASKEGQSTASDHDPTELDGESVYNLEEFPSLIEAEEIIDIFPLDSDSSEAQLSPVESIQVVRKTHHMRADLT